MQTKFYSINWINLVLGLLLTFSLWVFPAMAQSEDLAYAGSRDCADCHRDMSTDHDPEAHLLALFRPDKYEDAVLGDFSSGDERLQIQFPGEDGAYSVRLEDIAYVIGSGDEKQRYLIEDESGSLMLLPFEWNTTSDSWQALSLTETWPEAAYTWQTNCASCHVTGIQEEGGWEDDGVRCEACHGPGLTHVEEADDAGGTIDEDELALIVGAIIGKPDMQTCSTCHTSDDSSVACDSSWELFYGETVINDIPGVETAHTSVEGGPDCLTCHFTADDQAQVCLTCHEELTLSYAQRFIDGQQEETGLRLQAVQAEIEQLNTAPDWVFDALYLLKNDNSGGIHNIAYTESLLDAVELELGLVTMPASQRTTTWLANPEDCSECHAQEYRDWFVSPHANASLNDTFQSVYAENGQPGYCLGCHASGYDPLAQTYQYDGVVCGNCHTVTVEGEHPPAPVNIAKDPSVCGTCHSGGHASVYEEWLISDHNSAGVDCIDCHTPHSNSLLLDDVNTTCSDCHASAMNDEVHNAVGLICTDCHMTPRHTVDDPTMLSLTGHSMDIDPGVCADCHGSTHELTAARVDSQEQSEITRLQDEVGSLQTLAEENLTVGLLGGAIGVLLLTGLIYLALRLGRVS